MPDLLPEDVLYQALASDYGLEVRVSTLQAARAKLIYARRSLADPDLAVLEFRAHPTDPNLLWITKAQPKPATTAKPPTLDLDDLL